MSDGAWLSTVRLDEIRPNPFQPRREPDEAELAELAESIRVHGVLQPVVLRPRDDGYDLVAGERRWRAARMAGMDAIPAIIRETSDRELAILALLENLQRENLHFFEEAEGYARLLSEFELTQEELARQIGRSQGSVANRLRLLRLPPSVRTIISREMLSERHARALLSVPDEALQVRLAKECAKKGWTVRQLEERAQRLLESRAAQRRTAVVTDARIFINEFRRAARTLRQQGFEVDMKESVDSDFVRLEVTINLKPGQRRVAGSARTAPERGPGS